MKTLLLAVALSIAVPSIAIGQTLHPDAGRDRVLETVLRAFIDETISEEQLDRDLREYARAFEARPYKVRPAPIEWEKVPQERLFAFMRAIARIMAPDQRALLNGELTVSQAALKMAPFVLISMGHGMEADPDDPRARIRIDQLLTEIRKFSASPDPAK